MPEQTNPCPEVKVTEEIKAYFDARSNVGWEKYGVTMDRPDLSPEEWLTHMIDEMGDGIQYAWRLREELRKQKLAQKIAAEIVIFRADYPNTELGYKTAGNLGALYPVPVHEKSTEDVVFAIARTAYALGVELCIGQTEDGKYTPLN